MGLYGLRKPGVHNTGPVVSEHGFRTGKRGNTTEVIDSDGLFNSEKLAQSLDDYYIVETLVNYDVMLGLTGVDPTSASDVTLIDADDENYEVVILVRITSEITGDAGQIEDSVQFGYVGEVDAFGALTATAVGATQIFTGESADGANILITKDGEITGGTFDLILLAKELEE